MWLEELNNWTTSCFFSVKSGGNTWTPTNKGYPSNQHICHRVKHTSCPKKRHLQMTMKLLKLLNKAKTPGGCFSPGGKISPAWNLELRRATGCVISVAAGDYTTLSYSSFQSSEVFSHQFAMKCCPPEMRKMSQHTKKNRKKFKPPISQYHSP